MFISYFFKFLDYFGKGYGLRLLYTLFLAFMSSLLEFLSIVLVFPFILIMVNPQRVVQNPVAQFFADNYGVTKMTHMIVIVGGLIATCIIVKNIYNIFILYWQNKIMSQWGLEIKKEIIHDYLYSPYEADLKKGNTNTINDIINNVDNVIQYFVFKVIMFTSNTILIILIFTILLWLLPQFTLLAILFFTVAGLCQQNIFRKWGQLLADKKFKLVQGHYNSVINGLKNIKEIKINGCQRYFYNAYENISQKLIPIEEKMNLIPQIPQFVMEIIFILTMIILCLGILEKHGENPSNIIISFGIVAITIYRIVPQIFKSQSYLNYISMYLKNVIRLFEIYEEYKSYKYPKNYDSKERIPFKNNIVLRNLDYSYNKESLVLSNINLEIKKGEFIGIVGLSGAGKSTLVDCLLGLLDTKGSIYVDNILIDSDNVQEFRNIIGYVPQKITTIEGDIYANVAWGQERKDIDKEKVDEVLKTAQLYEQIVSNDNSIAVELKEDGTGLSIGQKQRIGIARALYREPEIIILDEATANLDVKVEHKLTSIIASLKGQKTIIAIAHRLSTLTNCDRIVYLRKGEVIDVGTFQELINKHDDFEEIVKLSKIKLDEEEEI